MNQTNITISHFSPLITYVPAMIWGDAANDPLAAEYWGQGYHSTNSSNGQGRLFFTWYGTDIWVHGGYRSRLGPYQVVVDSHVVAEFAGYQRGDIEATDAVLFNSTGLRTGPHILEIINTSDDANRPVLDINRIVYQHNVGDARNITAADPQCRWSSSTNASSPIWHSVSGSKTTYSSIGSMNISFTGTGIMLYGLVGPSNSPFLVTVDGTPQVMYPNTQPNTNSTEPHVLYTIDGLEPAQEHVLSVRNNPVFSSQSGASTTLNIHHAVVLDSSNGGGGPRLPDTRHANMVGGIVAGVIGLVIVPLLGFLLYRCFITRHRRLLQKAERELTPRPFIMQAPPPPRHRNTNRKMVDRVSATFSHLSHISGLRALTGAPATSEMPLSNSPSGPSTGYSNLATQATTTVDDEFSPTATVFTRTGSTRGPRQRSRSRSRTRGYGKTRQRPSLTTVPLIPPPLPSPSATHWPEYQLPMPSRAL